MKISDIKQQIIIWLYVPSLFVLLLHKVLAFLWCCNCHLFSKVTWTLFKLIKKLFISGRDQDISWWKPCEFGSNHNTWCSYMITLYNVAVPLFDGAHHQTCDCSAKKLLTKSWEQNYAIIQLTSINPHENMLSLLCKMSVPKELGVKMCLDTAADNNSILL